MTKLEGYSKVAVIKYGTNTSYFFALYDDGVEYNVGDFVAVSTGVNSNGKIEEIISVDEATTRWNKNITAEVIGKIDDSAYRKRIEKRKEKEKLKKEMNARKKLIKDNLEDEYYASKDSVYAEMLEKYNNL